MTGTSPGAGRRRLRELGVVVGDYPAGPYNAITDVGGVLVGHCTLNEGHGDLDAGKGPVRTGVTAILPNGGGIFHERVLGGGFVLNGAGELSGLTQVLEWGLIETPILLTNTLSVGTCSEAMVTYMVQEHSGIGDEHDVVIPLVGECDDSWLNDVAGRHVQPEHVFKALRAAASGPVAEGNVGGGTGMITCDLKGGIGTSSRLLPPIGGVQYTVGVLVMTNFGVLRDLTIAGYPLGRELAAEAVTREKRRKNYGSIIVVLATDAPLLPLQLNRLAKRAALGLGRCGSVAAHGSGEIVLALSTANAVPRLLRAPLVQMSVLGDRHVDPLYRATIEATEEAVLNALCMAEPMKGRDGHHAPALPLERVAAAFAPGGRASFNGGKRGA